MPLIVGLMFLIGLTARTLLLSLQFGGVTPLAVVAAPFGDAPTLDLMLRRAAASNSCGVIGPYMPRALIASFAAIRICSLGDGRISTILSTRVLTTSLSLAGIQAEVTAGAA
ncbi:hypothetical protein ACVWXM_008726 [Bradyrhizobium sp. GM7.3]